MVGKAQSEEKLSQAEGALPGPQPLLSLQSRQSLCPGGRVPAGTAPCPGPHEMPKAVPPPNCLVHPRRCTPAAPSRARRGASWGWATRASLSGQTLKPGLGGGSHMALQPN